MKFSLLSTLVALSSYVMAATCTSQSTTPGDLSCNPTSSDNIVINHDWSGGTWSDIDVNLNFSGTITINSGGHLVYNNGIANMSGAITVNGGGQMDVTSSVTDFGGDWNVQSTGALTIGGAMTVSDEAFGGSFNLDGYMEVAGDLTNDLDSWTGTGGLNVIGLLTDNGDINTTSSITLPVELSQFLVVNENGMNVLQWETLSEINNNYFEVQKSLDGVAYSTIGVVGGFGNSYVTNNYEYVDREADGAAFYRLKQVDFDGTYEYSHVVSVSGEVDQISIVQVGNTQEFYILSEVAGAKYNVAIYDLLGELVLTDQIYAKKGARFNYSLPDQGVFVVSVFTKVGLVAEKLVVK